MIPAHDSAFRRRKTLRPQASVRKRRLADHAARPRGPGRRERDRQVHAAEDSRPDWTRSTTALSPLPRARRAGYLPQDGLSLSGRTVFAECMSVFDELRAMEQEMEDLTAQHVRARPRQRRVRAVADRFHRHRARIPHPRWLRDRSAGGHGLVGLGFPKEDWQRQTEEFSGGWQMRIALAKLLLQTAEPAAARRADQPSRSRSPQLAGRISAAIIRTPSS